MSYFARAFLTGLAALSSACAVAPASVATFRNTEVPVTVGPVERLGAAPGDAAIRPEASLRVEAKNLYRYNGGAGGGPTMTRRTEAAGKFDVAIQRALDECLRCRVRVHGVSVGSHSGVLIGVSDDTHWTQAELHLYSHGSGRR